MHKKFCGKINLGTIHTDTQKKHSYITTLVILKRTWCNFSDAGSKEYIVDN